ncbi:hypothetical protein NH340_JMT06114 [Sarcoptes scabiei]|nr:hypothetical protein NH340_JMT06114 [Sarcoptes scabiei]
MFHEILQRYLIFWQNSNLSNPKLIDEADRLMEIANRSFDNGNRFHQRCLSTIFFKLTGNSVDSFKRYGHHWEQIGFQGSDPSTDFRGVGILGLFQLCFFVVDPKICRFCKVCYEKSLDSLQHYPFAITSINLTQIALQTLRDGLLNNEINRSNSVLDVFNRFYYGIFIRFYEIWKDQNKTIIDIGYVLKDLKRFARENIKRILKNTQKYSDRYSNGHKDLKEELFTNIIDWYQSK